ISPPADFRPSRLPAESRPLREDPPAFLCAIVVSVGLSNSLTVYTDSVTESSHFFLFPLFVPALAGFFAAALAGFFALVFAGLASAAGAASVSAFGFGSRLGRGATVLEGFAPPVRISVMRTTENSWR